MRFNTWATFAVGVCLTVFNSPSYSAAEDKGAIVAVVAGEGERAPSEIVVAKVEIALSSEKRIGLVERALIRKLLAEQQLTAAHVTDPATALRLGQLLFADLFLFIEKLPKTKPAAYRIHMIETKTGIALGRLLATEKSVDKDVSPVMRTVKSAISKLAVPLKQRRYVGLLGFRSEELGRRLDGLAEALGMLLVTDLGQSSNIVILDREHLDRLTTERDLTGTELKLKTSAVLLDGGVRRTPGEEKLAVTVCMRPLAGGKSTWTSVSVPANDLSTARRQIAVAVLDKLGVQVLEAKGIEPKKEAEMFSQRANILLSHGETEPAARAAEMALALFPCSEYRNLVCRAWNKFAGEFSPHHGVEGPKVRGLIAAIRVAQLNLAASEEAIRTHAFVDITRLWRIGHNGIYIKPSDATELKLHTELQEMWVRIFEIHQAHYWNALTSDSLNSFDRNTLKVIYGQELRDAMYYSTRWFDDATGYVEFVKNLIIKLEKSIELGIMKPEQHQEFIIQLTDRAGTANNKWGNKAMLPLLDWLTKRNDPLVRAADAAKLGPSSEGDDLGVAAAKAILDIFLNEIPPEHIYHSRSYSDRCLDRLANRAMNFFAHRRKKEFVSYLEPIIADAIEKEDARALAVWSSVIIRWLYKLDTAKAYEWTERILNVLDTASVGELQRQAYLLKTARGDFAKRLGKVKPSPNPWDMFSITEIKTGPPPVMNKRLLESIYIHKNDVILLWSGSEKKNEIWMRELRANKVPLTGGLQEEIGQITIPGLLFDPVTNIAVGQEDVYVERRGIGLIVFKEGEAKVWNEDTGLPSNSIESLVWYHGKLYLGFNSAFAEFDPLTNQFDILASAKRLEKRHALDGGKPYSVKAILVDEERKCLWLGILGNQRSGLWKYDPSVGTFTRLLEMNYNCIKNMMWNEENILARCGSDIILINPEDLSQTWLAGHITGSKAKPIFQGPCRWPVALVDNHLIECWRPFLILYPGAGRLYLPGCVGLQRCGRSAVVGGKGKLWKIEPKQDVAKERSPGRE